MAEMGRITIDTGGLEALVERMEAAAGRIEAALGGRINIDPALSSGDDPEKVADTALAELDRQFSDRGGGA